MAIEYRIYRNNSAGGPVDRTTPVATVTGLSAALAQAAGTDATYLVAAYDTVSGLEDPSNDARVRVVLAADGSDLTGRPSPPRGLSAAPRPGGGARLTWAYPPGGPAASFRVYAWPVAGPADYVTVLGTVARSPAGRGGAFSFLLTGLTPGTPYAVAVRAVAPAGEDTGTNTAAVTPPADGPAAVDGLAAAQTA